MSNAFKQIGCDLFCRVIDNYGDIGVCWRLARQLAHEHGWQVSLFLDDVASLHKLWPSVDAEAGTQTVNDIQIVKWGKAWSETLPVQPAQVVIEAFACDPPPAYIAQMAAMQPAPVWINLEYLSAETWVADCHGMASIHPQYGLRKTFFFPGFTAQTGGLLREHNLLAERTAFLKDLNDERTRANYLQGLGVPSSPNATTLLLFSYASPHVPALLEAWAKQPHPLQVLVPPTPALPQIHAWQAAHPHAKIEIIEIPFVPQDQFDRLLWACDILFIRGEDSAVRAQWAGKPLIWHIYPQAEQAHLPKLQAFLDLYCADLPPAAAQAQQALNLAWSDATQPAHFDELWAAWWAERAVLAQHAQTWQQRQANLLDLAQLLVTYSRNAVEKHALIS